MTSVMSNKLSNQNDGNALRQRGGSANTTIENSNTTDNVVSNKSTSPASSSSTSSTSSTSSSTLFYLPISIIAVISTLMRLSPTCRNFILKALEPIVQQQTLVDLYQMIHSIWIQSTAPIANLCHSVWFYLLDTFGDHIVAAVGTWLLSCVLFWSFSLVLMYLDIVVDHQSMRPFKLQPDVTVSWSDPDFRSRFWHCVRVCLFNDFFVALPFVAISYGICLIRGNPIREPLPSIATIIGEFAIYLVFEEIGFYYAHSTLHNKKYYAKYHKLHHEWTAPIGLTARYCTVTEHLLSNLIPITLGPLVCGSHFFTIWIWFILLTINSVNAHAGYHLPFCPTPLAHDFHHLRFNQVYGIMGVLDDFHGTRKEFLEFEKTAKKINPWALIGLKFIPADFAFDSIIIFVGLPSAIVHFFFA